MSDKGQIEKRLMAPDDAELRVTKDDSPKIEGYAARFNKWSGDLGGFVERIAPGAFDRVLGNDVRCLRNHNPDNLLGRTASGTLRLSQDHAGLRFVCSPPNTAPARDCIQSIERGDTSGCSFAFIVGEDTWDKEGTVLRRTIDSVAELLDVGPVTYPAYPDTAVLVSQRARNIAAQARALPQNRLPGVDDVEGWLEAADRHGKAGHWRLASANRELAMIAAGEAGLATPAPRQRGQARRKARLADVYNRGRRPEHRHGRGETAMLS